MRLRIESDGTVLGTTVRDADTGEELDGVISARWEAREGEDFCTASLEIEDVEMKYSEPTYLAP